MSELVRNIMNRELISLRANNRCDEALRYLSFLGVHAAPVVDEAGRPIGMLSLPDLLGDISRATVGDRMSSPALSVSGAATVSTAEDVMTTSGFHHLAVTDDDGKAIGFLSALDLLRVRMGREPIHPGTAPLAACTANSLWSDDAWLDRGNIAAVPHEPGHFLLVVDGEMVWGESSHDLNRRLTELLEHPNDRITMYVAGGPLKFRFAVVEEKGPHRLLGAQG